MTCLDALLAPGALTVRFQPIVEVQTEPALLYAVEGLVRGPRGSTMESARVLFEYVRQKRAEIQLDRACVAAVLAAAEELPAGLNLSINVHAMTLAADPGFLGFLVGAARARSIALERIIVEIVEHAPKWADPNLATVLDALRRAGIRIALDDIGEGQSNYRMVLDCKPDFFKIDRYFVAGAHADVHRQAVLESVANLADRFNALAIAEGVENEADLDTVRSSGIGLAQGYLFSAAVAPSDLAKGRFELASSPPTGTAKGAPHG